MRTPHTQKIEFFKAKGNQPQKRWQVKTKESQNNRGNQGWQELRKDEGQVAKVEADNRREASEWEKVEVLPDIAVLKVIVQKTQTGKNIFFSFIINWWECFLYFI